MGEMAMPLSQNRYIYGMSNPLKYNDPSGFMPQDNDTIKPFEEAPQDKDQEQNLNNQPSVAASQGEANLSLTELTEALASATYIEPIKVEIENTLNSFNSGELRALPEPQKPYGLLPAGGRRVLITPIHERSIENIIITPEPQKPYGLLPGPDRSYERGEMNDDEYFFHLNMSKQFDCIYIVCGSRSETTMGRLNRRMARRVYDEEQDAPEFKVPSWRNKTPQGGNELDYFVFGGKGKDLNPELKEIMEQRYNRLNSIVEFDNWNKFDPPYTDKTPPGGIVFDRGRSYRNYLWPWQSFIVYELHKEK